MHILHVIDTTGPGGAETVFIELADKLREYGHRSSVLIRGAGWVEDELRQRQLDVYILDAKGSMNVSYLRDMVALVKELKIDLIQSHLLGSNLYCSLLAFITRKPLVATFHGMVDVANKERFLKAKFAVMNAFAKRFVMVSKQMEDLFVKQYGLRQCKSHVIYNGISTIDYQKPKSDKLRQRLNLAPDVLLVGCLGNVRPAKAYDVLLDVASECKKGGQAFAFVVAGDPKRSLMEALEKQMQTLQLESSVHFIGFVDDTAEYLNGLDIFLLCSSSEGFSISTIEAMATALPVVATRCGGPEEIIQDGVTGCLVENGNVAAIVERLQYLAQNTQEMQALAQRGKQHVCRVFDTNSMLEQYQRVYNALL